MALAISILIGCGYWLLYGMGVYGKLCNAVETPMTQATKGLIEQALSLEDAQRGIENVIGAVTRAYKWSYRLTIDTAIVSGTLIISLEASGWPVGLTATGLLFLGLSTTLFAKTANNLSEGRVLLNSVSAEMARE